MFIYHGKNKRIIQATVKANDIQDNVIDAIGENKFDFECSNINNIQLAEIFRKHKSKPLHVNSYWYWSRRVNGKYVQSEPNKMFINTRGYAINDSRHWMANLVSLMYHERTHFLDKLEGECFFNHGVGWNANRYEPWKEATAPFYVDLIAESICGGATNEVADRKRSERVMVCGGLFQ